MDAKGFRDRKVIAVCCGATPSEDDVQLAYETGVEIAKTGAILVCGGLGGSMEAACRGASEWGGLTIGIIPTYDKKSANQWVDIVIPAGLGHARNNLVVAAAEGVIGVGGSWGTLSEIAIAVKMGKPVAVLESWHVEGPDMGGRSFIKAKNPAEAVAYALGEKPGQLRIKGL
jgi:uncharacterized protein (TIGR00725 family)